LKIRILLVDDHTILREGVRTLLNTQEDMEVVGEAEDGEQAVNLVKKIRPDIVLMDIGLPGINGIEATKRIKRENPEVKVLVLSMHDNEEYIAPVFQAGASGYVLKRLASKELVSALRAVHQGHSILHPALTDTVFKNDSTHENLSALKEDGLTAREIEVLRLIAKGLTNQQIADELIISIKTVQAHRSNIMEKLDLHDRVELTRYAIRRGLIQP